LFRSVTSPPELTCADKLVKENVTIDDAATKAGGENKAVLGSCTPSLRTTPNVNCAVELDVKVF